MKSDGFFSEAAPIFSLVRDQNLFDEGTYNKIIDLIVANPRLISNGLLTDCLAGILIKGLRKHQVII